jgi:hypothetical protein
LRQGGIQRKETRRDKEGGDKEGYRGGKQGGIHRGDTRRDKEGETGRDKEGETRRDTEERHKYG